MKTENEIMNNWRCKGKPVVSVCINTYNHENFVTTALDGVLMQETTFPFEIIVNDDCSTDNTINILKEYTLKYPSIIKLILQKENQYSKGIIPLIVNFEKAVGDYIAICEGDDYWIDPCKLQIQINEMRKVEDCQMSFHLAIDKYYDNSKKDEITTKRAEGNKLFSTADMIKEGGEFCPTASLIFKKEVVKNLPWWFYEAPFGDHFLQILGSLKGGALYIDRLMSVYRRNVPGSWSNSIQDFERKAKEYEKIIISLDHLDRDLGKQFHSEVRNMNSGMYLYISLFYLQDNKFKRFNHAISQSYHLAEKKSKKLMFLFYLRNFFIILRGIQKLNKYLAFKI